jgi:hypothetical protein
VQVERLLEYDAAPPPPLASPWLGGIGVDSGRHGDELFLSVSLRGQLLSGSHHARGLLFKPSEGRPRWALEVDRVVGLCTIEAEAEADPVSGWACPTGWLLRGHDSLGGEVRWFDVAAVERTLSGATGAPGSPRE